MNLKKDLKYHLSKTEQEIVNFLKNLVLNTTDLKEIIIDEKSLEKPPHNIEGDIAFSCFSLAKDLKQAPKMIAQKLEKKFESTENGIILNVKAVGPYLNLFLNREKFSKLVLEQIDIEKNKFGHSDLGKKMRIMVEYSSPNTNKPQHLGHVRNNVLGWTSAHLLEVLGFEVVKSSVVNDRGIHICKSMLAYQKWGEGRTPESENIKADHFVGNFYVMFAQKLKEEKDAYYSESNINLSELDDAEMKDLEEKFLKQSKLSQESQEMLQKWEEGDSEVLALWKKMNAWVYEGFEKTYQSLGIDFEKVYYESLLYKKGKNIITKALKDGKLIQRKDLAVIAPLEKYNLSDKVVLRSDGTSIYITQDINLAKEKFEDFNLDYSVYCIGSEQDFYMKQLFAVLELLDFPWASNMFHLSYGMVNLPDGKMKSREGTVVDADDLIQEMIEMSKVTLKERYTDLKEEDINHRAEAIAISSIKVYMLGTKRLSEMIFDPSESLSFEGKTGPYLQYVYARISSILRKADSKINKLDWSEYEINDNEWNLIKSLNDFPEAIYSAALSFEPVYLLNSLFEIAHMFNKFYNNESILKADNEKTKNFRIFLTQTAQQVIANGLDILGVEKLEVM
jgi:arginyl-tRNA synthetase